VEKIDMRMIRRCSKSSTGWNAGDLDVAFQLFTCGMVADGNLASKSSRDHLVEHGYAVRSSGLQAMTGKGVYHFLTKPAVWRAAYRERRLWKKNPFIATDAQIARSVRG
jgi:hypothetical protein